MISILKTISTLFGFLLFPTGIIGGIIFEIYSIVLCIYGFIEISKADETSMWSICGIVVFLMLRSVITIIIIWGCIFLGIFFVAVGSGGKKKKPKKTDAVDVVRSPYADGPTKVTYPKKKDEK